PVFLRVCVFLLYVLCFFLCLFFLYSHAYHPLRHSFPTRRSSDLNATNGWRSERPRSPRHGRISDRPYQLLRGRARSRNPMTKQRDRKSTRLNSSHVSISYAVFCLKKKINCISTENGSSR